RSANPLKGRHYTATIFSVKRAIANKNGISFYTEPHGGMFRPTRRAGNSHAANRHGAAQAACPKGAGAHKEGGHHGPPSPIPLPYTQRRTQPRPRRRSRGSRPPRSPPRSRRGGRASETASSGSPSARGISLPVAWSTIFIDRRTLPRSSKPSSLT